MSKAEQAAADTNAEEETPKLTRAQVAKLVSREVQVIKDGQLVFNTDKTPKMAKKPIKEDEILNHADYGDHVIVVTKDGKKLRGEK